MLLGILIAFPAVGFAQPKNPAVLSPVESFAPVTYLPADNIRAADGRPGPGYWQNRADYRVNVSFDTVSRLLTGKVLISYTNNSPVALPYLWLTVGQNRFRKDSRESLLTPPNGSRFGVQEFTEGCRIHTMRAATGNRLPAQAEYTVADNYLQVQMPSPLLPKQKATIEIDYDFVLPFDGSDYMGILKTAEGSVYQFGSMFPRLCVYDAVQGWNVFTSSYYVEPGSLDINITVPDGMIVQGTGELMNAKEVLTAPLLQRYQKAWQSDSVIHVRTAEDIRAGVPGPKPKTWRFYSENAGDGMWAISNSFLWDAIKVELPEGRTVLAMALYPRESNDEWRKITRQMRDILQLYSTKWIPYPYRTCVNIGGGITGVASCGVSVIHYRQTMFGSNIWTKTNHEIGHTWFNIMIAADSKNGWMCEGLNTLINFINCDSLKQESAFEMSQAIEWLSLPRSFASLNTPAASVPLSEMAMAMYVKPAVAFSLLREQVTGKERFDRAFRAFISAWAFKHPTPSDFFRSMENGTGEDLSWFWRGWMLNDWKSDPSIQKAAYVKNDPEKGINVTVENRQQMVMPLIVEVREFNGNRQRLKFPAQIWQQEFVHTFHVASTSPVISVTIDPGNIIPDLDRSNNSWKGTGEKKRVDPGATAESVVARYINAIGGREKIQRITHDERRYKTVGNSSFIIDKKYDKENESALVFTMENINFTLKKFLADNSKVAGSDLGADISLTADQQQDIRSCLMLFPELDFFDIKHTATLDDSIVNINGMDAYLVHVATSSNGGWDYYYDSETGLKIMEVAKLKWQEHLPYSKLEFSGYRQHNAILEPENIIVTSGASVEEVKLQ